MLNISSLDGKKTIQFPLRVSSSANLKINSFCKENGITRSHFLRQLIQNYFEPSTKSEL